MVDMVCILEMVNMAIMVDMADILDIMCMAGMVDLGDFLFFKFIVDVNFAFSAFATPLCGILKCYPD